MREKISNVRSTVLQRESEKRYAPVYDMSYHFNLINMPLHILKQW